MNEDTLLIRRELPSGPEVIKLYSYSNQLRMKLILLIVV